jgi:hypothetical protein
MTAPRKDISPPGPIVLFGSGETSPSGRKVFDYVLQHVSSAILPPASPRLALLETPAGFELNSSQVIGRVADFLELRLQNYHPELTIVPARMRGTPYSPDDPGTVAPLLEANIIFMGPGSPTYAVRQLRGSLAWQYLVARHRLGGAIVLASAAVVAISIYALPVYEIYKVGEDPHWKEGLDLFGLYGLPLVFIPHWNNNDGGDELDTSRCFMGQSRFARLMELLPAGLTVVGIDEKTALVMEPHDCTCRVIGQGGVTLLHTGHEHARKPEEPAQQGSGLNEVAQQRESHVHYHTSRQVFSLNEIGPFCQPPQDVGLPDAIWQKALEALARLKQGPPAEPGSGLEPPKEVLMLMEERQSARARKDWKAADALRLRIAALGWQVIDTPEGSRLVR